MELIESIYVFIKLLFRDIFAKNKHHFDRNQCQAHFNLGKKYMSTKQLERAQEEFLKAIQFFPYHAETMIFLGIIAYHKSHFQEAKTYFIKALDNDPKSSKAMYWVGRVYYEEKNYNKSEKLLKKAIKHNNKFLEAYHYLGLLYLDQDMYEFAIEYFKKTLEIDRNWSEAFLYLGKAYYKRKNLEKAIEILENAIIMLPLCEEGLILLGECYLSSGNVIKALEMAKQARDLGCNTIDLHYLLWRIYKVKGLEDMAQLEKKRILEIDPNYTLTLSLSDQNQEITPEDIAAISKLTNKFKKL